MGIQGTRKGPGRFRGCEEDRGKCHEEKERLERENRGVLGAFIPDCKDDGSYETKQCHGSTGYCWCVDESGDEIQGTRKGPGRFRGCEEDKVGVCGLPVDRGLGYANLPKFYYNKNSRRCEVFSYGGAGGNGNRFNSIAECQQECGPASDGKCHEEKERLERENRGV